MLRPLILACCLFALLFACGDGLEDRSETSEIGMRQDYRVDPATGFRQGISREYDSEGRLVGEENYVDDVLQGKRKLYHGPSGKVIVEETYADGEFQGEYLTYDTLGRPTATGQYLEGQMAGEWTFYYANGQVKERVTFAENNENGPFREWYEDGTRKAAGTYKDGDKENGILHLYAEDGTLERVMNCEMAVCRTQWTPDSTFAAPAEPTF